MKPDLAGGSRIIVKPMTLEIKLRLEYERLFEESFALMQLNKYSIEEGRFLFPDINLEVYRKNQRMNQIAKELEILTGVKTKTLIEDIRLG